MDNIDHLRGIYAGVGGPDTFVERQQIPRGTVRDESVIGAAVADVVDEMRERYGFETSLSTADLVAVVRGYYADRSDGAVAADLETTPRVVARARRHLHLLRDADLDAPVDLRALRRRLAEGATRREAAADLGASPSTVGRYARVLAVLDEARRTGYRYPLEFESALASGDTDADLAATRLAERRLFDEVHD